MPGPRGPAFVISVQVSATTPASRPGADALRAQDIFGHPDLLGTAGVGRGTRPAVGVPSALRELQATGESVSGADAPISTRFARRDGIPVHGLHRPVNRSGRNSVSRSPLGVRGGSRVRGTARHIGSGGGRGDRHHHACERGENQRLTDFPQLRSFLRARAKANPRCGSGAVPGGIGGSLGRAVSFGHASGEKMPGGLQPHRPRDDCGAVRSPAHTRNPWIQLLVTFPFAPFRATRRYEAKVNAPLRRGKFSVGHRLQHARRQNHYCRSAAQSMDGSAQITGK